MALTRLDRTASVRGLCLHYRETGAGGLPIVALHGHPGSAATWDEVAGAICAAEGTRETGRAGGYRVLALTQRGHGKSSRAASYAFEEFAADVFGFADTVGLDSFVLLGHSMGGTVASLAAASGSARVRGLILEDSVLPRFASPLRVRERPEGELPYDWDVVPALVSQFADPDPAWWASLERIRCPTLVVAGGSTSHVPQQLLADAAAAIGNARLVTVEGAGHTVHRSEPDRFVKEVAAFLSSLA
jgi:pimeloyl-ACP methyl ester carboxylesterase